MYNMLDDTKRLLVHYVLVACNEQDSDLVMSLTYESALDLIQRAGVTITEVECDYDFDTDTN